MSNFELKAHVADIVDGYQIALNVGSDHGVAEEDTVILYRTINVKDPITKEPLGDVTVPKLHLRVISVQDRLCVARVTDRAASDQSIGNFLARRLVRIDAARGGATSATGDSVKVDLGEQAVVILAEKSDIQDLI